MSVASSSYPIIEYATTALVAQASAGTGTVFSKVLPVGRWAISGSVQIVGDAGNLPSVLLFTPIRTLSSSVSATGPTAVRVAVAFLYESDGTTALSISATVSTSAGTWSAPAGLIIECYKLV